MVSDEVRNIVETICSWTSRYKDKYFKGTSLSNIPLQCVTYGRDMEDFRDLYNQYKSLTSEDKNTVLFYIKKLYDFIVDTGRVPNNRVDIFDVLEDEKYKTIKAYLASCNEKTGTSPYLFWKKLFELPELHENAFVNLSFNWAESVYPEDRHMPADKWNSLNDNNIEGLLHNALSKAGVQLNYSELTPLKVVKDMYNLVRPSYWYKLVTLNGEMFNIQCRDGIFLYEFIKQGMEGLNRYEAVKQFTPQYMVDVSTDDKKLRMIIQKVCLLFNCSDSCKSAYNTMLCLQDFFCLPDKALVFQLPNLFTGKVSLTELYYIDGTRVPYYRLQDEENLYMRPDLVIGNPPYDKDIYLDFVTQAHNLSQDSTVMITPAKWQAKSGKKNDDFRQEVVPYMRDIVYYKDVGDVFDIKEPGGVCYYAIDKYKHSCKSVKTVCSKNENFASEGFEKHDETVPVLLSRKILNIIGKAGTLGDSFKQSLYVKNTDRGESNLAGTLGVKRNVFVSEQEKGEKSRHDCYVEVYQGEDLTGYKKIEDLFTTEGLDKYKCIQPCIPTGGGVLDSNGLTLGASAVMILKPYQVPKGSFQILKFFDTFEEADNFRRYINSKLMSFLQFIRICGVFTSKEFFRYIPDPQDWTVIYEDRPLPNYTPDTNGYYIDTDGKKHCSLYVKYNLTPDEIDLIESVIKTRTKKA